MRGVYFLQEFSPFCDMTNLTHPSKIPNHAGQHFNWCTLHSV